MSGALDDLLQKYDKAAQSAARAWINLEKSVDAQKRAFSAAVVAALQGETESLQYAEHLARSDKAYMALAQTIDFARETCYMADAHRDSLEKWVRAMTAREARP